MNTRILAFNVIYYAIILFFVMLGNEDPSSSLGYGFFIFGFWIAAAIALAFLLAKKYIRPESFLDKVGIFTATPVLCIIVVSLILSLSEETSAWYFDKGGYRYKVLKVYYKSGGVKRIEYYRNPNRARLTNDEWLRDSTWIYLSEAGDTIKKVKHKSDAEIGTSAENR